MTGDVPGVNDEPPPAASDHDGPGDGTDVARRRTRRAWRIAGGGGVLGVLLALLVGALGATGEDGLRVALLVTSLGTAVGGLYATVTLLIDDLRKRPVGRGRVVAAGVLFFMTALLMAMVAGTGG